MATIEQFTRALLIIRKIRSGKPSYPNQLDLPKYIDEQLAYRDVERQISERTFYQDLKNINRYFGTNIQYSKQHNGYSIEDDPYRPVLDIEAILEPLEIFQALQLDSGLSDFIVTEAYKPRNTHYIMDLMQAIKKFVEVQFTYTKFDSVEATERRVQPYVLKQFNSRWYLIGKVVGSAEIRTFGLDRMQDLMLTTQPFKKDKNFDVAEKFKYSFGIYSSLDYPVEEVELSFDSIDGNYLKSVPLHSSQKILVDNGSEFVVSMKLRITHDFVMEILSRSNSLRVIKPESLKERIRGVFEAGLRRNG